MECSTARIQERAQHVENYRYGTIYVRKITKDHTEKDIQQVLNDVSIVYCVLFFKLVFVSLIIEANFKTGKKSEILCCCCCCFRAVFI